MTTFYLKEEKPPEEIIRDLINALKDVQRTLDSALLYKRIQKRLVEDIDETINAAIKRAME